MGYRLHLAVVALLCACNAPTAQQAQVLEVSDVELDYRSDTTVPIPDQYYVSMEVTLSNGTDGPIPLSFDAFAALSQEGLSYMGSPATELEPNACLVGAQVVAGRTASCRVLFSLRDGDLPNALLYTGLPRQLEVPITLCDDSEPDLCGYECVDLSSDPDHCGACNQASAGGTCSDGQLNCVAPESPCGGQCVDLSTNANHCGACDQAVGDGQICDGGVPGCTGALELCDGVCTGVFTDPDNCGACGVTVPPGTTCDGGEPGCAGGLSLCDEQCVDTEVDPDHCGACGQACPIPDGVDPVRSCDIDFGPVCEISFPTPGGRCVNVCGALGWQCDLNLSECDCMSDESAGACDCGCTLN
ncbi:MAG: hypothetical protein AAF721_14130 [Myxococcota bacterium]